MTKLFVMTGLTTRQCMVRWFTRNNFKDIFQSKIQLDSKDFCRYLMEQHGSRKYSMKAILETLASDKVKTFYEKNKQSALMMLKNSAKVTLKALHDRFKSWVICFISLIGPAKERIMKNRSQSVQGCYYPG